MRVIGRTADQPLLGLELRDAFCVQPVDQAFHLRHHFGADAVAGEKQELMGRHGLFPHSFVMAGHDADIVARGVLERHCADGKTPLRAFALCNGPDPCHIACCRSYRLHAPDRPQAYAHPARLILILSLAPTVGLGIGRFAYALVLPDMRDSLGWSYSAAGFMNTINAIGYLAGALLTSRMIRRFGLSATIRWATLACLFSLMLCALSGQFLRC